MGKLKGKSIALNSSNDRCTDARILICCESGSYVHKCFCNRLFTKIADEPDNGGHYTLSIAHNHPSGDPSPSPEDVTTTRRLIEAGKLLDMEILDHVIIGHQRYVSLKERGLAFE